MTTKKFIYIFLGVVIVVAGAAWYLRSGSQDILYINPLNPFNPMNKLNNKPAPELVGITHWLNSEPLTLKELQSEGKVVLVKFWTYSCINCIRTLPYINQWYDDYHDKGLVIIGVHSPEFAFEKETANVQKALDQFKIKWPVAQDNDFATWRAYSNQYWPAEYLIDQQGKIVYTHFGEGDYVETENAIRKLLGLPDKTGQEAAMPHPGSPEMYFGLNRLENLSREQAPKNQATDYQLPKEVDLNNFALGGKWQFSDEETKLVGEQGTVRLHFYAAKVYFVAMSDKPVQVTVKRDGQIVKQLTIQASQLYTLFESKSGQDEEATIDVEVKGAGLEAFTFTFG